MRTLTTWILLAAMAALPACDDDGDGGASPADAAPAADGATTTDAAPVTPDAATPDAAPVTPDAATPDAATPDAATPDASVADAARPDAATPDAALPDAAVPDAAVPDAAVADAAPPDAGMFDPLCGDELRQLLEVAADGLFFPSESDYPFIVVLAADDGAGPIPAEVARGFDPVAAGEGEVRDFGALFDRLGAFDDPQIAARYDNLRRALEANLTDLAVYRFNEIEVRVLILGRTACGEIAGVTTVSIET
jgi:hypothetical protein